MSCGIRRETDHHRYSSYKGVVGETFENVHRAGTSPPTGPWQKLGHRRHRVQVLVWQGLPRPGLRLRQPRDRRLVDLHRVAEPRAAGGDARHAAAEAAERSEAGHGERHGLAVPARRATAKGFARPGWCKACRRKGNCLDNGVHGAGLFGHIKDEFFRGRDWDRLRAPSRKTWTTYIVHWNTRRRQKKLKGLTPEEFRSQSLMAA